MPKILFTFFIGLALGNLVAAGLFDLGLPPDIYLGFGALVWLDCLAAGVVWAVLSVADDQAGERRDESDCPRPSPVSQTTGPRRALQPAGGGMVLIIQYPERPPFVTLAQVRTRSVLFGMN